MDDFDLLGEVPWGFEEMLDPQDLVDADLNVAELSALDGAAPSAAAPWSVGFSELKTAVRTAHGLTAHAAELVGQADMQTALQAALADVLDLPSPFRN